MEKIYIKDPGKEKLVLAGTILTDLDGQITFVREVKKNHFHRLKQAYGISVEVVEQLVNRNVTKVKLFTPDCLYESDMEWWLDKNAIDNYGHGEQVFVRTSVMKLIKKEG